MMIDINFIGNTLMHTKKCLNNEIYEYPKIEDNENKNEDNGRQEENDNKIEEIVQLPNLAQTVYTVINKNKKKYEKKIVQQTNTNKSLQ